MTFKVPYAKQFLDEKDFKAVQSVLQSDWLTQGPKVYEFEQRVAKYCQARFAIAVTSGTAALHLAALAADFSEGGDVITSPITFVATANAALYCGAKPVFSDVDPDNCCLDPSLLQPLVSPRTQGVIPVHFAGYPCDMGLIYSFAQENRLKVIEDASHALGASYYVDNQLFKVGSCKHSDMTTFSFHAVKNLTTGEGGMVTTNCEETYQRLLQLRSHGITRDRELLSRDEGPWYYEMQSLGFNYRITDIQSALGLSQLDKLEDFIARRKEITAQYNKAFQGHEELILLNKKDGFSSACHLYVLQFKTLNRLQVFNQLREKGLGVNVHYMPVHLQPYYMKRFGYQRGDFPKSELYYDRAVTIPLFPTMTATDVTYVIDSVLDVIKELKQ